MKKITLNLLNHRLTVNLTKRRGAAVTSIIPNLEAISNIKAGNKVSRYFRHIFEHKNVKKLLGANLAIALVATSFMPTKALALNTAVAEQNTIEEVSAPLTTERTVQFPVDPVVVTQGYGFFHPGLDLDGTTGDLIKPIKNGVIEAISRSNFGYGNAIIVDHGNGLTSLYGHLSKINVIEGEVVTTNTVIGLMGSTGHSTGDHLHLEVRVDGKTINPYTLLAR
jgi:murein DD-endopeptidase MepM/ murein hydrolase activator NlpD